MSAPLSSRDRSRLKARAHALQPVVRIGQAGVTPQVVAEVDRALAAHELIKVSVAADDRADRAAIGDEIARLTDAAVVHRVGKIVILWRRKPDAD